MQKALHPRDDVDSMYMSKPEGGRRLASISDSVDASIQRLEDYIKKRGRRLITATRKNTDNTNIKRTKITRKQQWEQNQLFWQTSEISHENTWTWLRMGNLKRETESLLIAAQNNAIKTNDIKARIDIMQQNSRCT